jgi:death-on-curing protein
MGGGREKLESALARPIMAAQYAEADLCEQASLLALGLAQAHAFVDNNKRVGYIVAVTFLRLNGCPLPADQTLAFAKHIEAAIEHNETVSDLGNWLREVTTPV